MSIFGRKKEDSGWVELVSEKTFNWFKDRTDERFAQIFKQFTELRNDYLDHRHCPKCKYVLKKEGQSSSFIGAGEITRFYACKYGHAYFDTNKDYKLKRVNEQND